MKMLSNKIQFHPLFERAKMFPPKPIKTMLPNWYKQMPVEMDNLELTAMNVSQFSAPASLSTIKKCIPVQDYLLSGYVLFTNTEILISKTKNEKNINDFLAYIPTKDSSVVSDHPHSQCPITIGDHKHRYIKFYSNWSIKTPKGYSCLFYQPFYHQEKRFTLFPAIVDTDNYNNDIGFTGYLNEGYTHIKVEAGTPLMVAFPFKRENWKSEIGINNIDEKIQKTSILFGQFFTDVYRNFFHNKKRFD